MLVLVRVYILIKRLSAETMYDFFFGGGTFLTVHPNIMIVFTNLMHKFIYFNTFIIFLYMFRALLCSSSGIQVVLV